MSGPSVSECQTRINSSPGVMYNVYQARAGNAMNKDETDESESPLSSMLRKQKTKREKEGEERRELICRAA